jgi:hypothetical protein
LAVGVQNPKSDGEDIVYEEVYEEIPADQPTFENNVN